jgi:hypothetical protein
MKQEQVFRIAMIVLGVGVLALLLQQQLAPKPLVSAKADNENMVREYATNLEEDIKDDGQELPMPENPEELVPEDLLPDHTADVEFAREHPLTQGNLVNRNYLDAGYIAGMAREPLRNTNLSIRAEPAVERVQLSPWNQSGNKPAEGTERRGFELGGCA